MAETALQHDALGAATPFFVDHNAGMVFRVAAADRPHQRVGSGDNPSAAQLEPGLRWLADFARASDVTVQVPMATTAGPFVAQISVPDAATPPSCIVAVVSPSVGGVTDPGSDTQRRVNLFLQ